MNGRCAAPATIALALLAALAGCGALGVEKRQAEALAERYFAALAAGDIAAALPLYAASFYATTPRSRWLAILGEVHERCGRPTAHVLAAWQVLDRVGKDAGTTAVLQYAVDYDSCRMSERITVFKPAGGECAIVGHDLDAAGTNPPKAAGLPPLESA